jgi:hypothetical protein
LRKRCCEELLTDEGGGLIEKRELVVDRTRGFVLGVDSIEVERLVFDEELIADVII